MISPSVGKGQVYMTTKRDSEGALLRADGTYRLSVPTDVPVAQFWSLTLYSENTRRPYDNGGTNTSDVQWRRYEPPFTIAYGEDLSKARTLVIEAVTALDSVYDDPEPVCYIYSLGRDGAEFRLRFYHEFESRIATRDEVAQTVIETLLGAGIKLGTPEVIVHRGGAADD